MQNKSAEVLFNNKRAGIITKTDSGYEFIYDQNYLGENNARPISISIPLSRETYRSRELFPFFEGLLPEGWLLAQTSSVLKIDTNDKFNLLLNIGRDTIGAVSIIPLEVNSFE